jgi:sterol desaturase/sphingolipid hydroxylase (fatty acid hydroxylase superfamily)
VRTALAIGAGAALAIWALWERLRPAYERPDGHRLWKNVALGVLGVLTTFAVVTPVSLAAASFGPGWREEMPFWLRFLPDLLALEFFIYWWHRFNHESPFLWRFHRVHHYDQFLDVTSAIRFHPGELLLSALIRGSYVLLLDISVAAILVFDALVIVSAGFHHANLDLPARLDAGLRRLVVTPQHHRVHHIPRREATDSNYGTLTTLFDRFFGTYRREQTHGEYGVEGESDRTLRSLAADPFRSPSP